MSVTNAFIDCPVCGEPEQRPVWHIPCERCLRTTCPLCWEAWDDCADSPDEIEAFMRSYPTQIGPSESAAGAENKTYYMRGED